MSKQDTNEVRIDKIEMEISEMHKTMKIEMKELKEEMKDSIREGFESCREIQPLKCEANFKKNGLSLSAVIAASSVICSVVCGVILFLAKTGMLDTIIK